MSPYVFFQPYLSFMTRNFLRDTLLPLLVFPTLSYLAFKYTIGHVHRSGLANKLSSQCLPTGTSPYFLPYTGFPSIDDRLCGLIAFFHAAMAPGDSRVFAHYLIASSPIFVLVPAIEGYREGRSWFIAFPLIFGLLSQVLTIGVTMPLYWLVFFLSGGRAAFDRATHITKAHAEAVIFGLFVGAAIPSICMVVMQDPTVTAIWQIYPVIVSLANFSHLVFRPPSKYPQSGISIIQVLYLAIFVFASSVHLAVIWPRLGDWGQIKTLLIPSVTPLASADTATQAMDFLKWDFTFGMLSMGIAQLWFAPSLDEIPFILFWYLVATPLLGPAATVVAANIWREGQIGDRIAIAKEKES